MSLSKRLFYNVYVTNGNLTADIISTRSTVTNSVLTNASVSNFISTSLIGTNISGTNISGANIIGTSLTATNLTVSNIIGTNLTVSNLNSIIGNFSTISSVYISGTTITGGSLSLSGDLVIGGTLTTVNITTTNATDTNITSGNINITNLATIINASITNASISNLLNTNTITTNVSTGTIFASTGITTGTINITESATATNVSVGGLNASGTSALVNVTATNVSTGTLQAPNGITVGNINFTGSLYQNGIAYLGSQWTTTSGNVSYTSGSVVATNVTATNVTATNVTATNVTGTNVTATNVTGTNVTATNVTGTNVTATNIVGTTITAGTLNVTTSTIATLLNTNTIATNISTGTLNASTGITAAGARITDANVTTSTIATARITSNLVALGNSNTIGNIFTTGGNVGINIASPAYQLDVNGNLHVKTNLYVDGLISGGTDTGSTFAYLTLTSTDDSINLSTGSLLTYGGITVQSPTDAISITNGGALLIEGGAAIGKRLFVGNGITSSFDCNTIGSIFTTGGNVGVNTTSPVYQLDVAGTLRISSLIVSDTTDATTTSSASVVLSGGMGITKNLTVGGNVNVSGISTQFAGSFAAANNIVSETDMTGFLLSNSVFGSFTSSINVKLVTLTQSLNAQYYIEGTQTSSGWIINDSVFGDDVGITFSITSNGQLQYTSANKIGWISTTINYQVTGINLATGYNYNSIVPTSGNAVISGNLSILSTMDANSSSSASLSLSGGLSVIKSVFVGGNLGVNTTSPIHALDINGGIRATTSTISTLLNTNAVSTNISVGTINASTGITAASAQITNITSTNITSTNITSTNITSTNITSTNITSTNITSTNITSTNISAGTLVGTTITGGNLSLSGNIFVGGTLTTVNITSTNILNTNISIGTIVATGLSSLQNVTATNISSATLNLSTGITTASAQITNLNVTTSTIATARITSNLISLGNSNTVGSIFTTGGNVGINTTSPAYTLDVVGATRIGGAHSYIYNNYNGGNFPSGSCVSVEGNSDSGGTTFNVNSGHDSTPTRNIMTVTRQGSSPATLFSIRMDGDTYINNSVGIGGGLNVSGTLSKGSGTFDIEHPLDTNSRLIHSFIEGPRCDLIYRGTTQLENGTATVNIDSDCVCKPESAMRQGTFEALVANPDIFLQNKNSFDQIIGNISGNVLTIVSNNTSSNALVSWMVIAERKDSFIREWNRTNSDGYLVTEYI
jgi:uncharacterized protein YjbI with pentapeptide repeats